jgi:hypothetical protein
MVSLYARMRSAISREIAAGVLLDGELREDVLERRQ